MPAIGTAICALAWFSSAFKSADRPRWISTGVDDEETKVRGDEFVAAAARVQFPAEGAEFFD